MKNYEILAEAVQQQGVDTSFGLVGDGNMKFLNHLTRECGVRYIAVRHEAAAVAAASAYWRSTGRVALCTTTQGPGLANATTALTAATRGRAALVLFAGRSPRGVAAHPQELDQERLVAATGATYLEIEPGDGVAAAVASAFRRAQEERRPVCLAMPTDLQDAEVSEASAAPRTQPAVDAGYEVDEADLASAAAALAAAQRPIVVVGRGLLWSPGREQILRLADQVGALLATTLPMKGYWSGHPYDIGVLGGYSDESTARVVGKADCVIAFGASLSHRATRGGELFSPEATLIQCDIDPAALGAVTPVTTGLAGEASTVAEILHHRLVTVHGFEEPLAGFRGPEHAAELDQRRAGPVFEDRSGADGMDPRTLMDTVNTQLPLERSVTVDGGHSSGFPSIHLDVPDEKGFHFSLEFGTIGLGMGSLVGLAVGRPDRLPVLVVGDGSFLMGLPDLETCIREDLTALILVMNDQAYGSELHILDLQGMPSEISRFRNPDLAKVAAGFGTHSHRIDRLTDLAPLESWLAAPSGVMVLDCAITEQVRGEWLKLAFARSVAISAGR